MSRQHKPLHTAEVTSSTKTRASLEDEIRSRAFALYQERGEEQGHDVNDWLRAEAESHHNRAHREAA